MYRIKPAKFKSGKQAVRTTVAQLINLTKDLEEKSINGNNILKILLIALLWTILCFPLNKAFGSDVEIVGSAKFTDQIVKALALLKNNAPEAYLIVTNYVKRIEQGERSGMWAYKTPPTYEMADKTTFYSVTWCAATIAHDSCHSKLYHDYKATHGGPVPDAVWTGTEAEKQCMGHQIMVMNLIGAPKREIDYSMKQAGGRYVNDKETWNDYHKNRNW